VRTKWLATAASVFGLGVIPEESQASGLGLFHRGRCSPSQACTTPVTAPVMEAPVPQEEMVTITRAVQVVRLVPQTRTVTYTYTEYVRQPDGSVVPVQRTGTRQVTEMTPVTEMQAQQVQVPASSPEALAFNLRRLQNELGGLSRRVGAKPPLTDEDVQSLQKQIDELIRLNKLKTGSTP